jgi:hypothetical protein
MDVVCRERVQFAPPGTRAALLSLVTLLVGCGGETGDSDGSKSPTSGGGVAIDGGSGGSYSTGGNHNTGGTGAVLRETGDATDEPEDNECKDTALYNAIRRVATGGGSGCVIWLEKPPEGFDLTSYRIRGAIVLDSEGRIVEVVGSGYLGYLDSYASESWPCYANQTIEYACERLL